MGFKIITPYAVEQTTEFSRASEGTYYDADGVLQTAAVDVPRFQYDPVTGESLGLLIEEQRVNVCLYSEQIDNAAWTKLNSTISANVATSPAGFTDADQMTDNATSGQHIAFVITAGRSTGTAWSVFMKKGTLDFGFIGCVQSGTGFTTAIINLTNGSVKELANGSDNTGSVSVQDYGNGWYRVLLQSSANGGGLSFGCSDGSLLVGLPKEPIYVGAGKHIFTWGCQLEDASFATSYIPTLGAAVTRSADAASKTGISALFGATSGTIFFETTYIPQTNNGGGERFVFAKETTNAGFIRLWQDVVGGNQLFRMLVNDGGVQQVNASVNVASLGISTTQPTNIKWAMAYELNRFITFINGVQAMIDTSGTAPSIDEINFNNTVLTLFPLAQAIVFPTALTNAQLEELTA